MSEESLKHFGGKVDELIKGRNLTRGEASDLFRQILNDEQPDLQQGAFLAAIRGQETRVMQRLLAGQADPFRL